MIIFFKMNYIQTLPKELVWKILYFINDLKVALNLKILSKHFNKIINLNKFFDLFVNVNKIYLKEQNKYCFKGNLKQYSSYWLCDNTHNNLCIPIKITNIDGPFLSVGLCANANSNIKTYNSKYKYFNGNMTIKYEFYGVDNYKIKFYRNQEKKTIHINFIKNDPRFIVFFFSDHQYEFRIEVNADDPNNDYIRIFEIGTTVNHIPCIRDCLKKIHKTIYNMNPKKCYEHYTKINPNIYKISEIVDNMLAIDWNFSEDIREKKADIIEYLANILQYLNFPK